jgi:integrase
MPKQNKPPKYCKMGKYALVYLHGRKIYLGLYGSPESHATYARLLAELQKNPTVIPLSDEKREVTVSELTVEFLDHAKTHYDTTTYDFYRIIVFDFLNKLYGDNFPVDDFKPSCLKLVRDAMVNTGRFCRRTVNRHTFRIISIFAWGVENDLVPETIWNALKVVKSLKKGYPGTFDHPEREAVPKNVVEATLKYMPPTIAAMVQLQYMTGMRPSEVFNMRVGDIDQSRSNGLWYYSPKHKTEQHIGEKPIPLGKAEQELIESYLMGKAPDAAVFSPRTAQEERNTDRRANRKTRRTPSHKTSDEGRATKSCRYAEFYNRISYRQAVEYAIAKGNKVLPEDQKIPHWTVYALRNSAATNLEAEIGLDEAQAQLGHTSANMTRRYSKAQLRIREKLARDRQNPFESMGAES